MITNDDLQAMLKAKEAGILSNCSRRKIGVYIPIRDKTYHAAFGSNNALNTSQCCTREIGICPALHAEVNAIINLGKDILKADNLYIWAEIPCHGCLSYIKRNSFIRDIFCLTTESYGREYPRVLDRTAEIALRLKYASLLGIDIHRLDAEEIRQYELYSTSL